MMEMTRPTAEKFGVAAPFAEDLRYLHALLTAAGIPFFLIRDRADRLAVAVDARHGAAVLDVLESATADEFDWEHVDSAIFRFGRRAPGGGLPMVETGRTIDIELWEFAGETVRCPRVNAVTRTSFELSDVEIVTVRLLDLRWSSFAGMLDAHQHDVDFDIDIVFSWVDGSDPALRARRAALMSNTVVGEGDDAEARIRQIDELRYALRSVHQYAPWIRRIFIATDSTPPAWLADHPKVTIVRAADHFSDTRGLPTFNSHAVESQLQHIDGLAEHFLYSNDDMFFARPARPSMFFTPGSVSKFIEAGTRIGPGSNTMARSGFENAARVNRRLLAQRFGHVITRHLEHTPAPLRRSVLLEMEREFPEDFARTRDSRFRSATDISVTNSLYHYYALFTGRAVPQEAARMQYVDTTTHAGLALLDGLAQRRDVDFFCLNDGSFPEVDEDYRRSVVSAFLADYFPEPAPWERISEPVRRRGDAVRRAPVGNAVAASAEPGFESGAA
jgi:hypothetical protein